MPWEIDNQTLDPDNVDKSYQNPAPGRYHVQVTDLNEDDISPKGTPQMWVNMEILSGTVAGQEGRNHREYFTKNEKTGNVNKFLMFALATRITTHEELAKHKAAGTNPVIDPKHAIGRQLCIELTAEMYEGKQTVRCNYAMFAIDSPKAKGIPLNQGMLKRASDGAADPFASGGGADPTAAGQPTSGGNDIFGGGIDETPF